MRCKAATVSSLAADTVFFYSCFRRRRHGFSVPGNGFPMATNVVVVVVLVLGVVVIRFSMY